jgi:hypothetical protein
MAEIINSVNNYNRQKKGRENNIIIFGIKDVTKDNAGIQIDTLFNKLNVNEIKFNNPILLVKAGVTNSSAPVKITLENENFKFQLLRAAKQLKVINQYDTTNISISQDLCEIDRIRNKKLIDEKKKLNEDLLLQGVTDYIYRIKNNYLVKSNI